MPSVVNEHNRDILALYGISLKKEHKAASIMRLKDAESDTRINRGLYEKLIQLTIQEITEPEQAVVMGGT